MENTEKNTSELKGLKGILLARKIPEQLIAVLSYFAYCFAYWPGIRTSLTSIVASYSGMDAVTALLGNELIAFLVSGLLPFVVTELLANICSHAVAMLGADGLSFKYLFRVFYGAGLIISGLIGLTVIWFPFVVLIYSLIVRFVVLTAAMALYLYFVCKNCVPPYLMGRTAFVIGRVYLLANVVLCFAEIITMVI